uniref:Mucin-1 n=1 Tax=Panthera tigris altaica TaxID=74533 RepID=A0A8C9KJJ2_PANTA
MTPRFLAPCFLLLLTGEGHSRGGGCLARAVFSALTLVWKIPTPATTRSCRETFLSGPGSVVVECTLAFRQGTTDALNVRTRLDEHRAEAARYGMSISSVRVRDASFPSAAGSGSGVPGWGIALLVLVCVLLALAVTVCQCRRKNCGQLDLFPPRDAYHPMSEYPTYHTHGRYIPPGSTRRSPYEEVSAGNGGGGRSSPTP